MKRVVLCALILHALLSPSFAMDPEGCNECHGIRIVERAGSEFRNLQVILTEYSLSSHGGLSCSDCHIQATIVPHVGTVGSVCMEKCHAPADEETVRKGHTEKFYGYQKDVHFEERVVCSDCHSEFGKKGTYGMSLKCLTCHGEEVAGNGSLLLATPVHGDLVGIEGEITCASCHSPHIIDEAKREQTVNCYMGEKCHGEGIVKKMSLGGHRKGGGGFFLFLIAQVTRGFVGLLTIAGVGIIMARKRRK